MTEHALVCPGVDEIAQNLRYPTEREKRDDGFRLLTHIPAHDERTIFLAQANFVTRQAMEGVDGRVVEANLGLACLWGFVGGDNFNAARKIAKIVPLREIVDPREVVYYKHHQDALKWRPQLSRDIITEGLYRYLRGDAQAESVELQKQIAILQPHVDVPQDDPVVIDARERFARRLWVS